MQFLVLLVLGLGLIQNTKQETDIKNFKLVANNNITLGSLPDSENDETTPAKVIKGLLKLNESMIKYIRMENDEKILKVDMNPFVHSVHLAYAHHLQLVIIPDTIWYLISSSIAIHINKNSEELRKKFFQHENKIDIVIERNDFTFDSDKNKWNEVIDQFASEIDKYSKFGLAKLFTANFSTTSNESLVVSKVVVYYF